MIFNSEQFLLYIQSDNCDTKIFQNMDVEKKQDWKKHHLKLAQISSKQPCKKRYPVDGKRLSFEYWDESICTHDQILRHAVTHLTWGHSESSYADSIDEL
jgi:hypothetical protein